jgi:hypothetical protein
LNGFVHIGFFIVPLFLLVPGRRVDALGPLQSAFCHSTT